MRSIRSATLAAAAFLYAFPAAAQSQPADEAPDAGFRSRVEAACAAAGSAALDDVKTLVDPAGSQSYGMALISGIQKGTRETRSLICVYDRRSRRAEVGTLLDLEDATDALSEFPASDGDAPPATAATLIYPGSATCGQDCLAHWTALAPDDQNQLADLPEQVRRTLAESRPGNLPAAAAAARSAALSIIAAAGGAPDAETAEGLDGVPVGERQCTLFWFGYMGEPVRVEDRFTCTIDRLPNGGLNVVRTSGDENLVYQVQLLGPGLAVIGGRNAPAGPPPGGYDLSRPLDAVDPKYGNEVGLGIARKDGRFFAASINERRIEPKDTSFFQMVAVDLPAAAQKRGK